MFKIYNKYIVPRFLNREMGSVEFNDARARTIEPARGVVLEIGFGSGYNLPFYKGVERVFALEPSRELFEYASERIEKALFPVEYLQHSAESIPLDDGTMDTVVSTWTMCSIPDLPKALIEIKRVLRPGGKLLFVEHGQSPKTVNRLIQKVLTPLTRHFTGNCHMDREISSFVRDSGLVIQELKTSPEEGRPLMFSYQGVAIRE